MNKSPHKTLHIQGIYSHCKLQKLTRCHIMLPSREIRAGEYDQRKQATTQTKASLLQEGKVTFTF